jgi:hypothetical protein
MTDSKTHPVNRTLLFSLLVVVGGAGVILAEYWYLHNRREDTVTTRADHAVAAAVEAARACLARGDLDGGVDLLEQALEIEGAGAHPEARALLIQARQQQARALLDGALAAAAAREATTARRKARAYLANPQAAEPDRARQILAELDRAESSAEANALLAGMSDQELNAFARTGILSAGPVLSIPGTREIFQQTVRGQLAQERQERAARLQATARRVEQLRQTALFKEVQAFALATKAKWERQKQQRAREQQALAVLFQELGVGDAQEQSKLRAQLAPGGLLQGYGEGVAQKRAAVKKAFRQAADHAPADAEVFDRLVDAELDRLLAELGRK